MLHSVSGAERGTEMRHSRKCLKSHPLYCCRKSKALHSRTQSPTQNLSGLNSLNKSLTGSYKQKKKDKTLLLNWLKPPVSNICVCLLPYLGWLNGSGSLGSISFIFCCLVHLYQHHVSNELPVLGLVFPYQRHGRPHHLCHREDSRDRGCHHWVVPYGNLVVIKYMEIFDPKVTFLKLNMFQRGHFF